MSQTTKKQMATAVINALQAMDKPAATPAKKVVNSIKLAGPPKPLANTKTTQDSTTLAKEIKAQLVAQAEEEKYSVAAKFAKRAY